jgi:hypothetical protein
MWDLKTFDWKQPVNQWLCIGLLAVMFFWFTLFYLVDRAVAVADVYTPDFTVGIESKKNTRAQNR